MNLELKPNDKKDLFAALVASAPNMPQNFYNMNPFSNTDLGKELMAAQNKAAEDLQTEYKKRFDDFCGGKPPTKGKLIAFKKENPEPTKETYAALPTMAALKAAEQAYMVELMYRWPSIYAANVLRHAVASFGDEPKTEPNA